VGEPRVQIPAITEIVRGALELREASLVIYRARTLVEFKTELLGCGLVFIEEDGHRSWQIGELDGHHCHLDIGLVTRVVFGAEPVSCQQGRTNYTVWFEVDDDCGNPYRPRAYFSVVLNKPYLPDGTPKMEIIGSVAKLYLRFADNPAVSAEAGFLESMPAMVAPRPPGQ
jgi:hypothetical protein